MTNTETKLRRKLENKLTYGRGLTVSEWDVLIPLRVSHLTHIGENPNNWQLGSRNLKKR
jgi:hypothetical protein